MDSQLSKSADREIGVPGGANGSVAGGVDGGAPKSETPRVTHFSRGRGVILALVGFEPLAFTVFCTVHVFRHLSDTSSSGVGMIFPILSLHFTFIFGVISAVSAFLLDNKNKKPLPADDLGFERGRVMAVLLLAAIGQGLAFFLCGAATMGSQESLFELGGRQVLLMVALVLVGATALYALLRPLKIPYVDYTESEDAKHWKLGGLVYYNPDDPRYLVEKRYGFGFTTNWAFRGFNRERWGIILVLLVPLILMSVALILVALCGGGKHCP